MLRNNLVQFKLKLTKVNLQLKKNEQTIHGILTVFPTLYTRVYLWASEAMLPNM